jgi:endonuclease G
MSTLPERVQSAVDRIRKQDEALSKELDAAPVGPESLERVEKFAGVWHGLVDDSSALATVAEEFRKLRPLLAPVFIVEDDIPRRLFPDAESKIWQERLEAAGEKLHPAIRAVGRIEVEELPNKAWVGTGALVARDLVITNFHVAEHFAEGNLSTPGFSIAFNEGGVRMKPSIDFLEEFNQPQSLVCPIVEVLYLELDGKPDLALFRIEPAEQGMPDPVVLADDDPVVGDFVVAIGYPAEDSQSKYHRLVKEIYEGVFDKKRVAPGQVTGLKTGVVLHDCAILTGNSGSPIVHLDSGKVVGLQFVGELFQDCFSVSAHELRALLDRFPRENRESGAAADAPAGASVTIPIHITINVGASFAGGGDGRQG